ncbi:MAG: hypothetical protein QXI71_00695 [Candidatus Bathyarchaeia archaeon]
MLIDLGVYGELLYYVNRQKLPERYQFKLNFSDGSGFTIFFSWFGYLHLVAEKDLKKHRLTANLEANPLSSDFCFERLEDLLSSKKKTRIRKILLDQKSISGIGNVYVQDILFQSRLHSNREISTLPQKEKQDINNAIRDVLNLSIQHGGLSYEKDFYGQKGKFDRTKFLVGYKEDRSCPVFGTIIKKIKAGSTSSYICPSCQR